MNDSKYLKGMKRDYETKCFFSCNPCFTTREYDTEVVLIETTDRPLQGILRASQSMCFIGRIHNVHGLPIRFISLSVVQVRVMKSLILLLIEFGFDHSAYNITIHSLAFCSPLLLVGFSIGACLECANR